MKNHFLRNLTIVATLTVLCAGVAEAGFWSRLFGKKDKETTTEVAATEQTEGGIKLDTQSAVQAVASVKSALASITSNADQLRGLLADRPELQGALDKALEAARKGDDLLALDKINEISEAAKLTDGQSKLLDSLKQDFEVLALGRNFPENGPVNNAISELKGGEYGKALSTLSEMAKDTSLTENQRSILNKIIGQHAGDIKRLLPF